jgi:uncharacterized membrane protein
MEFGNIGGVALILAALVWLAVFVPGWARRSELKQISSTMSRVSKDAERSQPPTRNARISRLLATKRSFGAITVASWLAAVALATFGLAGAWAIVALTVLGLLAILVSRAAAGQADRLLEKNYETRQLTRESVSKRLESRTLANSGWTPNPLPAPLAVARRGEMIAPDAEILPFVQPAETVEPVTQSLNSADIAEILRRRRAI